MHSSGQNVAGYLCHGIYSAIYHRFPVDHVKWTGNSGWWIIETIESFNGQPCAGQSDYWLWFSSRAFVASTGSDYSMTPIGAVTHVDEPGNARNLAYLYFGLWEVGKNFAICAWNSRLTPYFQAVGDPFVSK